MIMKSHCQSLARVSEHVIFTITLLDGHYFYPHFKDEKAEALRASMTLTNRSNGAAGPAVNKALGLKLRSL